MPALIECVPNFAVEIYHLSNASIGNKNPGINGAVQFMVGYTWH